MHSAEWFRTGTDFSSLVWTSPDAGVAHIAGGLWISKAFDRPHTWELRKNGVVFTSGGLTQSDPYTKSNPFRFESGHRDRHGLDPRGRARNAGQFVAATTQNTGLKGSGKWLARGVVLPANRAEAEAKIAELEAAEAKQQTT